VSLKAFESQDELIMIILIILMKMKGSSKISFVKEGIYSIFFFIFEIFFSFVVFDNELRSSIKDYSQLSRKSFFL